MMIDENTFYYERKIIRFPLLHGTVWTWLAEDYSLVLEGSYCKAGDVIEALCFLKG